MKNLEGFQNKQKQQLRKRIIDNDRYLGQKQNYEHAMQCQVKETKL